MESSYPPLDSMAALAQGKGGQVWDEIKKWETCPRWSPTIKPHLQLHAVTQRGRHPSPGEEPTTMELDALIDQVRTAASQADEAGRVKLLRALRALRALRTLQPTLETEKDLHWRLCGSVSPSSPIHSPSQPSLTSPSHSPAAPPYYHGPSSPRPRHLPLPTPPSPPTK